MSFWNQLKLVATKAGDFYQNLFGSVAGKYLGTNLTGAEQQANEFTAQQAQEQRNFEERMSNTAFQRQVADMQQAGVNPALMYGSGSSGASVPSGASAQSVSPGSGVDLLPLFLNYKLGRYRIDTDRQLRLKDLSIRQYEAETRRLSAESNVLRNQAYINNLASVTRGLDISNDVAEGLKQIRILQGKASLDLTSAQKALVDQTIEESSWRIQQIIAQTTSEVFKQALLQAQERLISLDAKDKAIYLLYSNKLYKNQADSAFYEAMDDALQYAYDKTILSDDAAKAVLQDLKARSKISQNAQYSSDLTRDVIMNRKRPDKYSKQFSNRDWEQLREGLVIAAYPNVSDSFGITGGSFSVSYTPNQGQYVK